MRHRPLLLRTRPGRHRAALAVTLAATLTTGLFVVGCADSDTAVGAAASADVATAATTGVAALAPAEAAKMLAAPPDGLVVLDVRTPEEFATGHLAGAVLVDAHDPAFADRLAALDRDVPYLVYCRSGNRSAAAVAAMTRLGFGQLSELTGGVNAWTAAGLALTRS